MHPHEPTLPPSDRTSPTKEALRATYIDHLVYSQARDPRNATSRDRYMAAAYAVRDRLIHGWLRTQKAVYRQDSKRVYYLSLEYLLGRLLGANLINLGLYDSMKDALLALGVDLEELREAEPDAGLGNGGLGRLAACFMDSLATLEIPAHGYGIRYEFGIFEQAIRAGYQVERADEWLRNGNPWEISRPEHAQTVKFGGRVEESVDEQGRHYARWAEAESVLGVPYDTPIAGYGGHVVNNIRLWQARATEELDLSLFNEGDYTRAVEEKTRSESISKVLYPNDATSQGKELRLRQQYFFVSCSIQDILRRYLKTHKGFDALPEKIAIQLNDTHPALAIAELMHLLIDRHRLSWEKAWELTGKCFSYTNHTLLSEALERWPAPLLEQLLPRHAQIIYEVNRRWLRQVMTKYPGDEGKLKRLSIVEDAWPKQIRMAYLSVVGSHAVNGVAALHTRLLKEGLFKEFHEVFPGKFQNKTNGVTPRRWLLESNPGLAGLITEYIGADWIKDLEQLRRLEPLAEDAAFRARFRAVKQENKAALAAYVREHHAISIDKSAMFDVMVKRLHEYKRQLLQVLHVIALYNRAKKRGAQAIGTPRVVMFGAKAAPGYVMAKLIIKLIHSVAEVVNADPDLEDRLKVVFLSNYRVSLAERIFPAADLSEQISTAGKEASGTGNMKFALNGALTIGTLDGANIEIRDEVGADNFFLFGLTAEQVQEIKAKGYRPRDFYAGNAELRGVIDLIRSGFFSPSEPRLFDPIVETLLERDEYLLLADFGAFLDAQQRASEAFLDPDGWTRAAILNVARMGRFSSDRTIREYADEIWNVSKVEVKP